LSDLLPHYYQKVVLRVENLSERERKTPHKLLRKIKMGSDAADHPFDIVLGYAVEILADRLAKQDAIFAHVSSGP